MSIDFEIPAEAKAIREKVRKWVHDECIPAEKELDTKPLAEVLGPLRKKARAQGLWCPWVPKEYGGMGLGPLANALVQMELGESMLGALSMNTQGPDDASMMTILAHGTEYQKEKFLKPLPNRDKRIRFSVTQKARGADRTASPRAAGGTACTTSPRRNAHSIWRSRTLPTARPSVRCSPTARRCNSCSPIAPASSISAG